MHTTGSHYNTPACLTVLLGLILVSTHASACTLTADTDLIVSRMPVRASHQTRFLPAMGTSSRFSSRKLSPSSSAAKLPATKDTNLATCSAQHGSTLVLGARIELSKHSRSVVMCEYAWACAGAGRRLTNETCCHVTAVTVTCSQPTQLKRNRHMDTAQSAVHMLGRMYARTGDTQWKLLCM